ncbi:hypothetical protein FA15DRAFT_759892 [Coprinopsis marcescibilis]|uniref:Uncharacterized protein n=1 Tax=Coprinopsis marcescibilis TaxID=230819 RepID=A0A5C3KHI2_COPMA|nr:hypothetical protein FA15DRAFT_759892 [Coprinopsis marcescibilis]
MATPYRIDDRDTSVAYSVPISGHHWTNHDSSTSHSGTVRLTRTRGATARVNFEGTRIAVYGLISPRGTGETPLSMYSVDSGATTRYLGTQIESTQSQVLFYDSGPLSAGSHTLFVTNEQELDFLWLDSFMITPNPPAPPEVPSALPVPAPVPSPEALPIPSSAPVYIESVPSPVATQVPVGTNRPSSPTPSNDGPSSSSDASAIPRPFVNEVFITTGGGNAGGSPSLTAKDANAVPVGAIVGGVLGALALIGILLLGFVFMKRRQRKSRSDPYPPPSHAFIHGGQTPFTQLNGSGPMTYHAVHGYAYGPQGTPSASQYQQQNLSSGNAHSTYSL